MFFPTNMLSLPPAQQSRATKLRERDVSTNVSDKVAHGTGSSLKIFVMTVSLVFSSASAS